MMLWNKFLVVGKLLRNYAQMILLAKDKEVITDVFDMLEDVLMKILGFMNKIPKMKEILKTVDAMKGSGEIRLGTNYNTPAKDGDSKELTGEHKDYGFTYIITWSR